MDVRLSRYVLRTPVADDVLLTSLLSRTVLRLKPDIANRICGETGTAPYLGGVPSDLVQELLRGLFLVPSTFDEFAFIKTQHLHARADNQVMNLIITPTLGCNMSCYYCFEKRRDSVLDAAAMDSLAALVRQNLPRFERLHVQWFGGEPLLVLNTLRDLTERLRNAAGREGKSYSAEVITNGDLLTKETTDALFALDVSEAQVTFEGAARLHERIRRPVNGEKGSFARLLENIRVASVKLAVTARVHVAPYSIDSVRDLLRELAEQGLARSLCMIYFAPLFSYGPNDSTFRSDNRRFMSSHAFAEAEIGLLREANSLGFRIPDPLNASYDICMAMQSGSLVAGPDGSLFKCYLDVSEPEEAIGSVSAGIDENRAARWSDYDFSQDPICRGCTFAPVCLGGCPKQEMRRADKSVICTPLKFNFHEKMQLAYSS